MRIKLRYVIAALSLWGAGLTACSGPPAANGPTPGIVLTHPAGAAQLKRGTTTSDLAESVVLLPGDQLSTTSGETAILQFPEGSILELGPASRLVLATLRPTDGAAVFQLLEGSIDGRMRSGLFEVQGYHEVAKNFRMVANDLTMALRSPAGAYRLWLDGDRLLADITDGEFDVRVGNQQTTLPTGWQVIAEPDEPLQLVSLITPTALPDPPTAAPSATLIPTVTLTNTPTAMPTPTSTPSATATARLLPTRTRVLQTVIAKTPVATAIIETPLPAATEKPNKPPRPTAQPPTQSPPTASPPTAPPPPPTAPPPTEPPPTPRPTVGG